jgi:hypothetical protein
MNACLRAPGSATAANAREPFLPPLLATTLASNRLPGLSLRVVSSGRRKEMLLRVAAPRCNAPGGQVPFLPLLRQDHSGKRNL